MPRTLLYRLLRFQIHLPVFSEAEGLMLVTMTRFGTGVEGI